MYNIAVICAEKEVIELATGIFGVNLIGIIDPDTEANTLGHRWLGSDQVWAEVCQQYPSIKAVIALDTPKVKQKLTETIYGIHSLGSLVSPFAIVSPSASLGDGCIIQHRCSILACAKLGIVCKVNTDAVIHHDCTVGDYCTLAPGSRLLGRVKLGDRVFVGAGAIVLPRISIGADSVIGAGAVVINDVEPQTVMVGVPARPIHSIR
jgi:sugar O-acyltransferase (sialic acid O-acetyltransferase NeuD family)